MASIRSIVTKMDLRVNNCFLYAEEGKTREEERRHPDRGYPGLPLDRPSRQTETVLRGFTRREGSARPYPAFYRIGADISTPNPGSRSPASERSELDASVAEIHDHPLRPHGFEEPLFFGRAAKKAIAEHLKTSSSWLRKAGEAHAEDLGRTGEVCHVLQRPDGSAYLVRAGRRRPGTHRRETSGYAKRRIARVIERWREVRGWWNRRHGRSKRGRLRG